MVADAPVIAAMDRIAATIKGALTRMIPNSPAPKFAALLFNQLTIPVGSEKINHPQASRRRGEEATRVPRKFRVSATAVLGSGMHQSSCPIEGRHSTRAGRAVAGHRLLGLAAQCAVAPDS